jgi:AmiR/NasT family two-component response regulator
VQLQTALSSRVVIEQAKGALAERLGIDVDEAYRLLRRHARAHGRKLTTLAHQTVEGTADFAALRATADESPAD